MLRVSFRMVAASACLISAALAGIPLDNREQPLQQTHLAHPRDTSVSLQLGLELERDGSLSQAEAILLEAARLDHQYQPAWTLANFYFRRERPDLFWRWAARATAVNRYDLRPLLRLANLWVAEPRILISRLGNSPELLRPYLDLLIAEARFDAAQEVADLLRVHHDPLDRTRLVAFERRIEDHRQIRSAGAR